jgi:hypothetical protein
VRGQEVADGHGIARIKGHDGQSRAGTDLRRRRRWGLREDNRETATLILKLW